MSKTAEKKKINKSLPKWNVILLNDNNIPFNHIVDEVSKIMIISKEEASTKAKEAHEEGKSLLTATHFERAELYKDQFSSCIPPVPVIIEKVE